MEKIIVSEDVLQRIDQYLNEKNNEWTRSYIQKLISEDKIKVNGNGVKASYKVKENDVIEVEVAEVKDAEILPENIPLDIVYEDEDIVIVNKPKGMVVHPGNGNYSGTMVNSLMYSHRGKLSGINGIVRPGIVHRIDKDTSGLLVVAKNDKAHKVLADKFKEHDITREYICLVKGIIQKDNITINLPIGRSDKDRKKMAVTKKNSRNAITHIKVLKRYDKYTLLEINIETGRTHQIRVHLSYIGYPIIGDCTYSNGKNEFGVVGQCLHAKCLEFKHPITGTEMKLEAPLPKYFEEIIQKLDNE